MAWTFRSRCVSMKLHRRWSPTIHNLELTTDPQLIHSTTCRSNVCSLSKLAAAICSFVNRQLSQCIADFPSLARQESIRFCVTKPRIASLCDSQNQFRQTKTDLLRRFQAAVAKFHVLRKSASEFCAVCYTDQKYVLFAAELQ